MRIIWSKFKRRILLFLSVFGPVTITAIADNDAAGVATYSLSGAKFGYSILFILGFATALLAITQEMGVRIATVTGKGLGDLIRERFGIRVSIAVFTCLFLANLGTIVADFAAVKTTAHLFNLPVIPLIILIIFSSYFFVSKGNYKTNQRIFLVAILFYFLYIVSAFKARPDWGKALISLLLPTDIKFNKDFILGFIAVLGTTITPWGQFFVHSYVIDKKISAEKLKYAQIETYFGAFLTDFFSFFMIVATAATLFVNRISLTSGEEAAIAIKPFAGELASLFFGLGILNAGFIGIVVISLSSAYAFSEFFGYVGSLDASFEKGKLFYSIFLFQLVVAALIVFIPQISLFRIVFYTQSINAILLPITFYFLLKFANDKELMGQYTNYGWYNKFAIISSFLIIISAIFTVVSSFL